jgi:GNAT superfamily N-acetyltransferase
MRLHWDWLQPLVTVPYVPALGPVHPLAFGPQLFDDVLSVAGTGCFLPYDKDIRWGGTKHEQVLVADIVHNPERTLIPTLSTRGSGAIKVHVYGSHPDARREAVDLTAKLSATHGVARGRIVWFHAPDTDPPADSASRTRIQLREFGPLMPTGASDDVMPLTSCAALVQQTFADFADKLSGDGFGFLYDRMKVSDVGPVLVTLADGRVAGVIGPMVTMPDSDGRVQLLPQYFAVLPEQRGRGHGRALWRAAMHWGNTNAAAYQVLQTVLDGPSDRLCRAEGLTDLGTISAAPV